MAALRSTDRADGDMVGAGPAARSAVAPRPWTRLRQVHSGRVVVVGAPGDGDGEPADAAVTTSKEVALAVLTADCAPVVLASPEGVVGVAHAGWRGLLAGILGHTVDVMVGLGARRVEAWVGPCIEPGCYRWDPVDLAAAVEGFGPAVEGCCEDGSPAFDLPGGVREALRRAGVTAVSGPAACTACSPLHWSWRAGGDTARQATVAWLQ